MKHDITLITRLPPVTLRNMLTPGACTPLFLKMAIEKSLIYYFYVPVAGEISSSLKYNIDMQLTSRGQILS